MPNANSFADGRRGRVRPGETDRVAAYAASTLPVGGPGMLRRTLPSGTLGFPLPTRRRAVAATVFPWQPYPSKWRGAGPDPYSVQRKMRFRLYRGKINGQTPANMADEFTAFGNVGDTDIEEDDAVYTQIYAKVTVSEETTGSGLITYSDIGIHIVEGDSLPGAGVTTPPGGADGGEGNGRLPAYVIVPLGEVAWWGGKVHYLPGYRSYLDLTFVTTGTDCEQAGRQPVISGAA